MEKDSERGFVEPDMATIGPDLASGYEVSDDGLTYTIDFIGGAKWSDGEEITLDDVVFSIKANLKAAASNGIQKRTPSPTQPSLTRRSYSALSVV